MTKEEILEELRIREESDKSQSLVKAKESKAEYIKELRARDVDSSSETYMKSLEIGVQEPIKAISDVFQYLDPTGGSLSYEEATGRDLDKEVKDIEKHAFLGRRTIGQELIQDAPTAALTSIPMIKASKIGTQAWEAASVLRRAGIVAKEGAIENVLFDFFTQRLRPEGEKSTAKIDPGKAALSATIGATVPSVGYLGVKATGAIVKHSKEALKQGLKSIEKNRAKIGEAMDAGSDSWFSKIDPTSRNANEDLSMTKRIARTATRIMVRKFKGDIAHLWHDTKVVGSEIAEEVSDLMKTKYKKFTGKINEKDIAEEAANNVFKRKKEKIGVSHESRVFKDDPLYEDIKGKSRTNESKDIKTVDRRKKLQFDENNEADLDSISTDRFKTNGIKIKKLTQLDKEHLGNVRENDMFKATPGDVKKLGFDDEFDYIFITDSMAKSKDLGSKIEEEIGHILDSRMGLTEKASMEIFKKNKSNIAKIYKEAGLEPDANTLSIFHPSEIRQRASRLQSLLETEDGIGKVFKDNSFNTYAELSDVNFDKINKLASTNKLKKGHVSKLIEDVFDNINTRSGFKDDIAKFTDELKSKKILNKEVGQKKQPTLKEEISINKALDDIEFWDKPVKEIKKHYDTLNDDNKLEFIKKFEKDAKISKNQKMIDTINEKLEKLDGINTKVGTNQKKMLEKQLSDIKNKEMENISAIFKNEKIFDEYKTQIKQTLKEGIKEKAIDPKDIKRGNEKGSTTFRKLSDKDLEPYYTDMKKRFNRSDSELKAEIALDKKEVIQLKKDAIRTISSRDMAKYGMISDSDLPLYRKLQSLVGDVEVVEVKKLDSKHVQGTYFTADNVIVLKKGGTSDTPMHELVHAATVTQMRKNRRLLTQLEEVAEQVGENVDEMMAKYFSETNFNKRLNNTVLEQNLYNKIKNIIKRLLRIKPTGKSVGSKLDSALDAILKQKDLKPMKTGAESFAKDVDSIILKSNRFLRDNNILHIDKTGKVKIGSYETNSFKSILNDLGISNKNTINKIKELRRKTQGLMKQTEQVSKAIAKTIKESGVSNESLERLVKGRVAKTISLYGPDAIRNINLAKISHKYKIKKLSEIIDNFGQAGTNSKYHFKNVQDLYDYAKKINKNLPEQEFKKDIELLVAKKYWDGKTIPDQLLKTLVEIERMEDGILGSNMMHGYAGFSSKYNYDIKVAKSIEEINELGKEWNRVGKSNTFYRLSLDSDMSSGILPVHNKKLQGTLITKNLPDEMKRLMKEKIKFSPVRTNGKITALRLFPDKQTGKVLKYETDISKLMARKYKLLVEESIRKNAIKNIGSDIKSLFSVEKKAGYKQVPDEISNQYKKVIGQKDAPSLYVREDVADMLIGVKESLLYTGDNRTARIAEKTYKDMLKRFKRAVTVKSPSSIVNNYIVIPSTLKMNGVPISRIPKAMHQAHIDYADFIVGMEKYQYIKINKGHIEANKFLKEFRKENVVAEMMEHGAIQSGLDDALIQLSNESDMFSYGFNKVSGVTEGSKLDILLDNIELKPNSTIGSFFLNKFAMADIVGRVSLYSEMRFQGKSIKKALDITSDAFVDYTLPLPKPIRLLEEYGVPFIGWMYRMQYPLYKMAKNNPDSVATVVAIYMMLDGMDGDDNGHIGSLKSDSWFLHNAAMDSTVFSSSPILNADVPDLKPQLWNEAAGVATGTKHPAELLGLNVNKY